jgi:multidrug efflux pump subunit AcrB
MATTFTILAVFLPVGFMTGLVGQFFKSFALTVAFAVGMSLMIAFTLDPMLSSRFVRYVPPEERVRTRMGRLLERWGHLYDRLDRRYHSVLRWALGNPIKVVAAALIVFMASLSTLSVIGTEFVPNEDRGEFVVMVDLPPGTAFDETVQSVAAVERMLLDTKEVRQVFTTVGTNGQMRKSQLRVMTTRRTRARPSWKTSRRICGSGSRRFRSPRSRSPIPSSCRARRTSRRSTSTCAAMT